MSRSRKKPVWTENNKSWAKRQANKTVRRYKNGLSNGSNYRKLFCSWDITDYRIRTDKPFDSKIYYSRGKKIIEKYNDLLEEYKKACRK